MQNVCCSKGNGAVDQSTEIRWFNFFQRPGQNVDDLSRSEYPKTMDYEPNPWRQIR